MSEEPVIHDSSCVFCKKTGINFLYCSNCKFVRYCSKECQLNDWKLIHKKCCKNLAEKRINDYNIYGRNNIRSYRKWIDKNENYIYMICSNYIVNQRDYNIKYICTVHTKYIIDHYIVDTVSIDLFETIKIMNPKYYEMLINGMPKKGYFGNNDTFILPIYYENINEPFLREGSQIVRKYDLYNSYEIATMNKSYYINIINENNIYNKSLLAIKTNPFLKLYEKWIEIKKTIIYSIITQFCYYLKLNLLNETNNTNKLCEIITNYNENTEKFKVLSIKFKEINDFQSKNYIFNEINQSFNNILNNENEFEGKFGLPILFLSNNTELYLINEYFLNNNNTNKRNIELIESNYNINEINIEKVCEDYINILNE